MSKNSTRNERVDRFIHEIIYGTFESQSKNVYPRFREVMKVLNGDSSIADSYIDDFSVSKEYSPVTMSDAVMASFIRSRPIASYNNGSAMIWWIDPEEADLYAFEINPLAFVQIEDAHLHQ